MNKRQKLVQKQFLNDEEKIIKRLKQVYDQSYKDITGKISKLDSSIADLQKAYDSIEGDEIGDLAAAFFKGKAHITPEEAKETLRSMIQSKVYQKNYQAGLEKQVGGILEKMQDKAFKSVSEYLNECYEDGFIGTMFDLQGQGIPLCFPLDQESIVRAVQLDSKISKGLYSRLGEDVKLLKKRIASEVSRGVSTGMSYAQMAQQLKGVTNIGFNNAVRITRTEGHRIQCQAGMDACEKAKEAGADVVKQWDSTLDGRTRESHAKVDGEIKELDEKFGNGLMFPGDPKGGAGEVVNCRCALLQRARWALDDDELQTLKDRAAYYGLDKTENFEDYKKKYLKAAENINNSATTSAAESDIMQSGARSGALTSKNDPKLKKREAFAKHYYSEVLGRNREYEIAAVAKNSGMPVEDVDKVFAHIFELDHLFDDGTIHKFIPDYDMAQSWIRLREGKNIQDHDRILLMHELMEANIMGTGTKIAYDPVHDEVEKTYNYVAALRKYLKENNLV